MTLPTWMAATSEPSHPDWSGEPRSFHPLWTHASMADIGHQAQVLRRSSEAGFADNGRTPDKPASSPRADQSKPRDRRRGAQWVVDAMPVPNMRTRVDAAALRRQGPVQHYLDSVIIRHAAVGGQADPSTARGVAQNYLMCAPLSHSTFKLLADEVVPSLNIAAAISVMSSVASLEP